MTPSDVTGWRFVEDDLHRIAGQVIEYDHDARLIREDETGHLGLARWQRSNLLCAGGYWAFARTIHDLDTDLPLAGEPDARVMRFMRAADSHCRDMRAWDRKSKHAFWMRDKREHDEMREINREHAERFVHAARRDTPARPRAFIRQGIPRAA